VRHCGGRCRAVHADPIEPELKAPGTKRLKPQYNELLSNFAFKLNRRRYTAVLPLVIAALDEGVG